jgi:hypothetical protein
MREGGIMDIIDLRKLSERLASTDDLLRSLGLETRRTTRQAMAEATGWFGAGVLVGAGIALLLAPRGERPHGTVGDVTTEDSRPLTQM